MPTSSAAAAGVYKPTFITIKETAPRSEPQNNIVANFDEIKEIPSARSEPSRSNLARASSKPSSQCCRWTMIGLIVLLTAAVITLTVLLILWTRGKTDDQNVYTGDSTSSQSGISLSGASTTNTAMGSITTLSTTTITTSKTTSTTSTISSTSSTTSSTGSTISSTSSITSSTSSTTSSTSSITSSTSSTTSSTSSSTSSTSSSTSSTSSTTSSTSSSTSSTSSSTSSTRSTTSSTSSTTSSTSSSTSSTSSTTSSTSNSTSSTTTISTSTTTSITTTTTCSPIFNSNSSLVAYFPMDSSPSYLTDVGGTVTATAMSVTTIPGERNQALSFTGTINSYFQISNLVSLGTSNNPFSIGLYIRPNVLSGTIVHISMYISGNGGWCLPFIGFDTANHLAIQIWGGSTADYVLGPILPLNSWTHVVQTWSSANGLSLYINGMLYAQNSTYTAYAASGVANYLTLASTLEPIPYSSNVCTTTGVLAGLGYYNGSVDELRVYSRELSGLEVCALAKY